MSASWHADPTGRHQLRWWDGTNWTDHVADNGTTSIDPIVAAPPVAAQPVTTPPPVVASPPVDPAPATGAGTVVFAAQPAAPDRGGSTQPSSPTPSQPAASAPPWGAEPSVGAPSYLGGAPAPMTPGGSYSSAPKKKNTKLLAIVGGAVATVILIVVVVVVIISRNDPNRTFQEIRGTVRDNRVLALRVSGKEGAVITVFAAPTDRLDVVVGLLVTRDQLRRFHDKYRDEIGRSFSQFASGFRRASDLNLGDLASDFADGYVIQEHDEAENSDDSRIFRESGIENAVMTLPTNGRFAVVVFPYEGEGVDQVLLRTRTCRRQVRLTEVFAATAANDDRALRRIIQAACPNTPLPLIYYE